MSVVVSNSPVFSSSHHKSIFSSSTLSPRSRVSPSSNSFRQSYGGDGAASTSGSSPATAVMKRKRPARLDIPMMNMGFGAPATPRPVQESMVEDDFDGLYSVCCKKGRRAVMEDRFSAVLDIQGDSKQAFFGVFDGHGGVKAAEYVAENLNKNIMAEVVRKDEENTVEEAVKHGYLKTDSDFLEQELLGGSCCVTALITKGDLIVSNAGDCRAVLSRGGVAEALTADHRPSRQDEKDRIEALGGYIDSYNGVWRIQGSLAVSRGIGDRQLKQWVIAEPETKVLKIKSDDEFLILASDGLWDKVTNQEAVDLARPLCTASDKIQPLAACKKLIELSVSRGSLDDISVMIIQLPQYMN
ncbi:probable protein phosphatase 2C 25 [Chenopodium quinoa]|uniref:probable protein phosphatase 2C 25 n=1 Tax=Chenopodium quinoa TaxID=63459 RepID=UPI000B76BFC3|nr:probable protein phosphatase 2C 25 [Chenopodium quinoa]